MKKLSVLLTAVLLVASCSQMTTSKSELADLKTAANNLADAYSGCVVKNALSNASQTAVDVADVVQVAENRCQPELELFKSAQQEYLSSQVMMTKKPLQQSVDDLNARANTEALEALIAAAGTQPAGSAAPMAGTAAVVSGAAATAPAAKPAAASSAQTYSGSSAAAPAGGWNAQQRIYLDCMEDQANKYSALNESAGVVADVAQSRCKSYMAGPGVAALEQEGRTMVMGLVLDAKLQGAGR